MIVQYHIGSTEAHLKVTAIHALHGGVIRDDLKWALVAGHEASVDAKPAYNSKDPQAHFEVAPGDYQVVATYQGEKRVLGKLTLAGDTLTDAIFVLQLGDHFKAQDEQYFTEEAAITEYERRQEERVGQARYGATTTPLRDPYKPAGEYGMQFDPHPMLQVAAFDGIEPNVSPEPSENELAARKTLENQLANQARPDLMPKINPT